MKCSQSLDLQDRHSAVVHRDVHCSLKQILEDFCWPTLTYKGHIIIEICCNFRMDLQWVSLAFIKTKFIQIISL